MLGYIISIYTKSTPKIQKEYMKTCEQVKKSQVALSWSTQHKNFKRVKKSQVAPSPDQINTS